MTLSIKTFERDTVIQIINSVIEKVEVSEGLTREQLFHELKDLQKIIEEARSEISASGAHDIKAQHIKTSTDELDAVVSSTAEATMTIMNACENIEKISADEKVQNEIIRIYEACSFQDITGQRIKKVVSSLKQIDEKVGMLLKVIGDKMPGMERPEPARAALLNGPQLPANAISQEDIDKLLASFD